MAVDMDKFTDDFVAEWNGKQFNVNGANLNFDGRYGNQCMDLWNYWWTELGLSGITRNPDAAAVWENVKGTYYKYFDGILPDQPAKKGDVFIYNRKAWGTGYGHIGIVLADLGDRIKVFEANGLGDGYEDAYMNQYGSPPRIHIWPKTHLYGYLRFIQEDEMAATPEQIAQAVWSFKNTAVEKRDAYQILRDTAINKLTNLYGTELTIGDQIAHIDKNLNDARILLLSAVGAVKAAEIELDSEDISILADKLKETLAPDLAAELSKRLAE